MQLVAWTSMFVNFSTEISLETALKRTFDGNHACKLCQQVQKAETNDTYAATLARKNIEIAYTYSCYIEDTRTEFNYQNIIIDPCESTQLTSQYCGKPPIPPPRQLNSL